LTRIQKHLKHVKTQARECFYSTWD